MQPATVGSRRSARNWRASSTKNCRPIAWSGLPDFFPKVTQRELMVWWRDKVPEPIREALWAIQPLALSQTRIAGNITLPVGFSIEDTTITAIVSQPTDGEGPVQPPNGPWTIEKVGLPDGAAASSTRAGTQARGSTITVSGFAAAEVPRGLRVGVAIHRGRQDLRRVWRVLAWSGAGFDPDIAPDKKIGGVVYPYPTIAPLTDEEIGSAPLESGKFMPWDGVQGPRSGDVPGASGRGLHRHHAGRLHRHGRHDDGGAHLAHRHG